MKGWHPWPVLNQVWPVAVQTSSVRGPHGHGTAAADMRPLPLPSSVPTR
eukprot:CAMPEP_0174356352 /NCGR_PEP_ID=MMETSP0811_2-20130205/30440_1 /TAXON_ID=73025 ORGANISM="Eutreptiella gymnastica-like, Strain CCMP1594" /NCGR_SAMPLE_ID=MMETSP0811_2 /ASSEMBLY_ACC=CAM_ASM_000667 /LENGTH=48 /DNA_ID= /DNA_START= /DNA_END= /DNA_ORIENTATION=